MPPPPPILSIVAVLAALVGLLALLGRWQLRSAPHPELVRKAAHVCMGLIALNFGWLFRDTWPVWTLCAGSFVILAVVRWWRPLGPHFRAVLGGVGRRGGGEFCFALAVALLFALARSLPSGEVEICYVVPILILTLADTAGALVGVFCGHTRYAGGAGRKSVEGSLAFYAVTLVCTTIPCLFFGDLGVSHALLLGVTLSLVLTPLEALCRRGLDNLLVPLVAFEVLRFYLYLSMAAVAIHSAVLALLIFCLLFWLGAHNRWLTRRRLVPLTRKRSAPSGPALVNKG